MRCSQDSLAYNMHNGMVSGTGESGKINAGNWEHASCMHQSCIIMPRAAEIEIIG